MFNKDVEALLNDCDDEFTKLGKIIQSINGTNPIVQFLTKYSIIKACGTIEQSFKMIISDKATEGQNKITKNYIDKTFRENSMNPSLKNIYTSLARFEPAWKDEFRMKLKGDVNHSRIVDSINSLNESRNQFAHGGNPTTTFNNVVLYFSDGKKVIEYIDLSVQ